MATQQKSEKLSQQETAPTPSSTATAEAEAAGQRLAEQTAAGLPPQDILEELAGRYQEGVVPINGGDLAEDFFDKALEESARPEPTKDLTGEELVAELFPYAQPAPAEVPVQTESPITLEELKARTPMEKVADMTDEERVQREKFAIVNQLREQPEEEGRQARAEALGEESLVQETNRNLWLRNEVVNGLAEKVRAGAVHISQGHGGFRLVVAGEGMPPGAGGVFTAAELREYGLDVAAEFAANNPDAKEAYDPAMFEPKTEATSIEEARTKDYERVVTGLAAFEDSVASGDLNIIDNNNGMFSFQGEGAPTGMYSFDQLEGAGLFAIQDARERASQYGEESEEAQAARMGELRAAIGGGLIGRIRSGEDKQVVVQTHKGWKVKGLEGVYTAAELRSLGVIDAAQEYATRHSEDLAQPEVEATAVAEESADVTPESVDQPADEKAPVEEEAEDAAPEPESEPESEDTPEQTENRAAVEQAKIDFEKMTVAEIREFIKKGEQLIALMETFQKAIEASEIEEEQKAKLLEIVGKIVEAQTALNAEAQATLEAKEAQEAQKTEIADVQSLINELMEALTFTDETLTPEQQKNQEKQQSLLTQLMTMLLQMLFTPQSSRNA